MSEPAPAVLAAADRFAGGDGPVGRLVALDFDGTLAPLVDDPAAAAMTPAARAAVDRLAVLAARPPSAGAGRLSVALVSGRDVADLAARSGAPPGTWLVGSHGAETGLVTDDGVDAAGLQLTPEQERTLDALRAGMTAAAAGRRGAWVQDKPSAAVLHTRLTPGPDAEAATAAVDAVSARLGLHAMHGKDVVEVAVVPTSKGIAVANLRDTIAQESGLAVRVLFAGDDTTDETALAVLQPGDLGIKVGPGPTVAEHRVAGADALAAVLEAVADGLEG